MRRSTTNRTSRVDRAGTGVYTTNRTTRVDRAGTGVYTQPTEPLGWIELVQGCTHNQQNHYVYTPETQKYPPELLWWIELVQHHNYHKSNRIAPILYTVQYYCI